MNEMIKMVVVLTLLSSISGGLLAALRDGTKERIEIQELQLVKGPAVRQILKGCDNDPVADRFKLTVNKKTYNFFVGKFDGKPSVVAFETFGKGFADAVGLMVAINVNTDKLVGVGVTTHKETPGLGARAKDDPTFVSQFKGLPLEIPYQVTADGGKINAMSGATFTSRGVCSAATDAVRIYKEIKPQLTAKLKEVVQ